ncbi:hypothetical protein CAEBREN_29028 [Caenorhabditis brenneri]|uniref:Uncharacterized protein n=1 Tax=Caenorhabditis brenneri TaxID=135651 RepID=G0M8N9_CAEBE|nr:hypothetical protein CAEBREN_29028 [Caenorhabditis brenneri]
MKGHVKTREKRETTIFLIRLILISSNGYAGKSFDFSSGHGGLTASESNALVKVSADFLRLNGSRQQFKNLLSARKKLGSLPPAYTRIDYSRESLDSHSARVPLNHHGPVITVEDTGSQLRINNIKPSVNQNLLETSCSFEKKSNSPLNPEQNNSHPQNQLDCAEKCWAKTALGICS